MLEAAPCEYGTYACNSVRLPSAALVHETANYKLQRLQQPIAAPSHLKGLALPSFLPCSFKAMLEGQAQGLASAMKSRLKPEIWLQAMAQAVSKQE
jgi:hypothetical protein